MDYGTLIKTYDESYWSKKYTTRKAFLEAALQKRPPLNLTAKGLHDKIADLYGMAHSELASFPEFSEQERAYRRDLSARAHRALMTRIANVRYSHIGEGVVQKYRYVRDLMAQTYQFPENGEPETEEMRAFNAAADAKNERLYEVMNNMREHRSEAIALIAETFRKWEESDPLGLLDHPLTDEEVVNNFERIHFSSNMALQLQNFADDMRSNGITLSAVEEQLTALSAKENPTEAEQAEIVALTNDVASLREIRRITDRFKNLDSALSGLSYRMGMIESPYYEIMDYTNVNVQETIAFVIRNESMVDPDLDDPVSEDPDVVAGNRADAQISRFSRELPLYSSSTTYYAKNEYQLAMKQFEAMGVEQEDVVFTTDEEANPQSVGADGRPFFNAAADMKFTKTTLFDANNPEQKVEIDLASDASLVRREAVRERAATFLPLPTPPEPARRPVAPEMSGWQSFWNGLTGRNAYTAEAAAYAQMKEQYEKERIRYERYLRERRAYEAELERVTRYREQYVAAHPDDAVAAAALEEQRRNPPQLPAEPTVPEAVEAKTRQFTPPQGSHVPANVFDAEYIEPNMEGVNAVPAQEAPAYLKPLFESLNTCCGIQLGTEEQDRLFYLDKGGHLCSCGKMDVYNTKDQIEFVQLLRSNRLFAIPAGETTPVQVQLADGRDPSSIRFADNLGRPPKAPNINRFWARMTGSGREQVNAYKKALAQSARCAALHVEIDRITSERAAQGFDRRALTNAAPTKGSAAETELAIHRELALGEQMTQAGLRRFDEAEAARVRTVAEKVLQQRTSAFESIRGIYGAVPQYRTSMAEKGCYTAHSLRALKPFDLGLLPSGTPAATDKNGLLSLTEDDFAALAVGATTVPEIAENLVRIVLEADETQEAKAKAEFQLKNDCVERRYDTLNAMIRNDLVKAEADGEISGRQNVDMFFKTVIHPARQAAADAVVQYRQGNRQPMARLIAHNLMEFERSAKRESFDSLAARTVDKVYALQVKMMEADPALKQEVVRAAATIQDDARDNIASYEKERAAIRAENPAFEACLNAHNHQFDGDDAKKAYAKLLGDHKTFPDQLLKDASLVLNTAYAKQKLEFNVNKTMQHINGRATVCAIFDEAKAARNEATLARLDGRALTIEEKQRFLKATLREELLLRHDKSFKKETENTPKTEAISNDPSISGTQFPFPGKNYLVQNQMAPLVTAGMVQALTTVNDAFSPLYMKLAQADVAEQMLETSINMFVPEEKQQEICAQPDEEFIKSIRSPYTFFNEDSTLIADEVHSMYEKEKELQELQSLSDEPMPDEISPVNAPMV